MVALGPRGPGYSDRRTAGPLAEATKILQAETWHISDWRRFSTFEKALLAYLRHSDVELRLFFDVWHNKLPPLSLSSSSSPYRSFVGSSDDTAAIEAEYKELSKGVLRHLTDLVGYDIRLVAGREYDAQLSSQCGITVFQYLRDASDPAGDPAKQNELRGLMAAYDWDFSGTGDEIAIMLYEAMAIWSLIDGNEEAKPFNFFTVMFEQLDASAPFAQNFANAYKHLHFRHEHIEFKAFLMSIETYGSSKLLGGPRGSDRGVFCPIGQGRGTGRDDAAPESRMWSPNPGGRRCVNCVAWGCKAGEDETKCICLNDALSLAFLAARPYVLQHVLSQRIRLLEPGGKEKIKAGNYVLHRDKDKCVELLQNRT